MCIVCKELILILKGILTQKALSSSADNYHVNAGPQQHWHKSQEKIFIQSW